MTASHPVGDDRDRPTPDWRRPPEPPIHRAARKGDIAELERLVASGANVNKRADLEFDHGAYLCGLTPLMVAARSIDGATVETLRWLLDHGADLQARSKGSKTAAWHAAGHGGRLPFHRKATTSDHALRLALLLDAGIDPAKVDADGRSLLTEACAAGDPARVRLLLERGAPATPQRAPADGRKQSKKGRTLNVPGMPKRSRKYVRCLPSYEIPLFQAAESGSAECVRLLIDAGADPNERDESGETPLMHAGSSQVVHVLVAEGADVRARCVSEYDALEHLFNLHSWGADAAIDRMDIARALLAAGADLQYTDKNGWSRLHGAAFRHQAEGVKFLLDSGADQKVRDEGGATALHKICWQGEYHDPETNEACRAIVKALVAAGVDPNAKDTDGATPLHEAASGDWGNATAIRTLLRLGADPNLANHAGETPLMLAAERGEAECVAALLEGGADPHRKSAGGASALDCALSHAACYGPEFEADREEIGRLLEANERAMNAALAEFFGEDSASAAADVGEQLIDKNKVDQDSRAEAAATIRLLRKAMRKRDSER